ncbi:MAG: SAM-dependent methyltransferase, partial [Chlamydiae bacterium]|nr:SAM-dependent methyltransferase [Chlamydiota bacterium]
MPKALNCDFLRGLCDRIGFHNWIQYTTLFHLVSMSFFHWTQVSQLHIGDAIAVPTGSFGDFSAFVRSVADLNTLHKEGIAFEIERSAMFSYTKAMCAGWQINQWLSTNQGIIKLGIIFQFLRNALLNIFRQSAKLAIGSRGELNLEHKGIYTSPNFFLTFSKGMYPFFSASEMDLRKEVSKPGSSGNFDSISSISHPEGLTRLSWYSSVENRSTSASSMSESTSSNANVSKIKNLGALFLSTMTAAFECFPNLKRVEAIAFRKGKSFSAPRFDKAFMLHPPGINRIQNEIHLSSKYSAKSHIFWDRIQSIELTGFERVYDIEVEGTHNFIGNGIVAHNTYMTSPDPSSPKVSIGDPEVGVLNPLVPEGVGGQSKAEPAMTVTSTSEPEAEVERGNVISRELTPIQGMLLKKERSLKRDGHHAWLSRLLVEKQIQLAEQSILIVQNALNDELYLFEFVKAMANLERVATFFEVSRDGLQEILGHPLSSQEIYFRYRAFIEFARTQPEDVRKELEKKDGKFPKEEIDPGNFQAHLAEQIKFFNGERPNLRQSLNKILSENPDKKKLKEEALQWLDYFLYSTEFSFDFYLELSDLMKLAGFKSFEGLLRSRKSKSSPAELNIMEKIRENQEGRMTYHEFMRMALYDPEHGFYTKPRTTPIPSAKAGEGGEFRTLPEEFGQFGRGLAYDLMDQWKAMGKPTRFQIIEMGAGQGTMAEQILSTIKTLSDKGIEDWPGFFKAIQYTIVEI